MGDQLLKDIYLFKEFLPKELDELSAKGTVKTYNQGDTIFDEGDKAQSLYVVRHGTVHIRRPGKQDDVDLVKLGGGAFPGRPFACDHAGPDVFAREEPAPLLGIDARSARQTGYAALGARE